MDMQTSSEHLGKLRLELETMRRIRKSGIHPIDILDQMLDDMFQLARSGIRIKYPNASPEFIEQELIKLVNRDFKLRNKGK